MRDVVGGVSCVVRCALSSASRHVCFTFPNAQPGRRQPTISRASSLRPCCVCYLAAARVLFPLPLPTLFGVYSLRGGPKCCLPFLSALPELFNRITRPFFPVPMTLLRPISIVLSQASSSSTQPPSCPPLSSSNTLTMTTTGVKGIAGFRKQIIGELDLDPYPSSV